MIQFLGTSYHNFFTVCALIPMVFMISMAIIFFSVKNKSKATFHYAMCLMYLILFFFAYFISAYLYHPLAAYHRWLTMGVILIIEAHMTMFFFNFPEEWHPGFARKFLMGAYIQSFIVCVLFYYVTYHSSKIYNFGGHYWDFDEENISKFAGILILLNMIIFFAVSICKTVVTKTKERWAALSMGMVLFLSVIIPGLANTVSREGLIDRGNYQVLQDLCTIIGFFIASIIYINTTKDRTTFMTKIFGFSLTIFLIVFQILSLFSLMQLDSAYNALRNKDLRLILKNDKPSKDLRYLISYTFEENTIRNARKEIRPADINFCVFTCQYINTRMLERIKALPVENFKNSLDRLFKKDKPIFYFNGYRKVIQEYASKLAADEPEPGIQIEKHIGEIERNILYASNKIKKLPEKNFKKHLKKYCRSIDPLLAPFGEEILDFVDSGNYDDPQLKSLVLEFLAPMKPEGSRIYRKDNAGTDHFSSFMYYDAENDRLYEAGFSYLEYRKFIHPISLQFVVMLLGMLALIFIGSQFFFLGSLIRPFKKLLGGMREVGDGNLDINIPVKVEDEIGYLTHSFNRLILTIKTAKQKIDEHTNTLEAKVKERTAELENTRDQLWGEMKLAKKIQTMLLPVSPGIPGCEISAYMQPTDEIGGDYYDVINAEGIDWIVIGDVSGHGVPAGLIMMMVQTSIHTVLAGNPTLKPDVLLQRVNQVISENLRRMHEDKYMTIIIMACLNNGEFLFSGLHQDILVYRNDSKTVEAVETEGLWLGFHPDMSGILGQKILALRPGDVMLLYTDGIVEATKEEPDQEGVLKSEMFGSRRLSDCLKNLGEAGPEEIKNGILEELKDFKLADDITLLVVKKT